MRGLVILSHGLESGPDATKVSALADAARELGWDEVRPDYRDLDATQDPMKIDARIERLLSHEPRDARPLVLAGSSMGAFISGFASLRVRVRGLFLLAPPLALDRLPHFRVLSLQYIHHAPSPRNVRSFTPPLLQ